MCTGHLIHLRSYSQLQLLVPNQKANTPIKQMNIEELSFVAEFKPMIAWRYAKD